MKNNKRKLDTQALERVDCQENEQNNRKKTFSRYSSVGLIELEKKIENGSANKFDYSKLLNMLASEKPPQIEYAVDLLNKAIDTRHIDPVVFNNTLKVISAYYEHFKNKVSLNTDNEIMKDVLTIYKKAKELHNQTRESNFLDKITYSHLFKIFNATHAITENEIQEIYQEAVKYTTLDGVCYANILEAIANFKQPNLAWAAEVFDRACKNRQDTPIVYKFYLLVAASYKPNADLKLALSIFKKAQEKGILNAPICSYMITACLRSNDERGIDEAWQTLKTGQKFNMDIRNYNSIIDAIAHSTSPNLHLALKIFEDAKDRAQKVNNFTYNCLLNVIAKCAEPDSHAAFNLFNDALKAHEYNEVTFSSTLEAFYKSCPAPDRKDIEAAYQVFNKARDKKCLSTNTYNFMIELLSNSPSHTQEAIRLFKEAVANKWANEYSYSKAIKNYQALNQYDLIISTIEEAKAAHQLSKSVYQSAILALAQADDKDKYLPKAKELLSKAEKDQATTPEMYNIFLNHIAKSNAPDIQLVGKILEEVKNFADTITYTSALDAIAKSEQLDIDKAKEIFLTAKMNHAVSTALYNTMLNIYAIKGELSDAWTVFEEATRYKYINENTYTTLLKCINNNKAAPPDFTFAYGMLKEASRLGLSSAESYTAMFSILRKVKHIHMDNIIDILKLAIHDNKDCSATYNQTIYALTKRSSSLSAVLKIFDQCVRNRKNNSETYSHVLYVIANSEEIYKNEELWIQEGFKIFNEARQKKLFSAYLYANMMLIMSRRSQMQAGHLADVYQLLNEAENDRCINAYLYSTLLKIMANHCPNNLRKARSVFDKAKINHQIDAITYQHYLHVLAKSDSDNVKEAEKILNEAIEAFPNQEDIFYPSFFDVIAKSKNPHVKLAMRYYDKGIQKSQNNPYFYSTILHVIAKSKKPDIALGKKIFDKAKSQGILSSYIFNNMLLIIKNANNMERAEQVLALFDEIKKNKLSSEITYSITLNALLLNPHLMTLIQVFEEAKAKNWATLKDAEKVLKKLLQYENPVIVQAISLFEEAKQNGFLEADLYQNVLDIMGNIKINDSTAAMNLVKEACQNRLVTAEMFYRLFEIIKNQSAVSASMVMEVLHMVEKNGLLNDTMRKKAIIILMRLDDENSKNHLHTMTKTAPHLLHEVSQSLEHKYSGMLRSYRDGHLADCLKSFQDLLEPLSNASQENGLSSLPVTDELIDLAFKLATGLLKNENYTDSLIMFKRYYQLIELAQQIDKNPETAFKYLELRATAAYNIGNVLHTYRENFSAIEIANRASCFKEAYYLCLRLHKNLDYPTLKHSVQGLLNVYVEKCSESLINNEKMGTIDFVKLTDEFKTLAKIFNSDFLHARSCETQLKIASLAMIIDELDLAVSFFTSAIDLSLENQLLIEVKKFDKMLQSHCIDHYIKNFDDRKKITFLENYLLFCESVLRLNDESINNKVIFLIRTYEQRLSHLIERVEDNAAKNKVKQETHLKNLSVFSKPADKQNKQKAVTDSLLEEHRFKKKIG